MYQLSLSSYTGGNIFQQSPSVFINLMKKDIISSIEFIKKSFRLDLQKQSIEIQGTSG